MKVMNYKDIESLKFDSEGLVKGVTGRVAAGKNDGADNFCMRVFEVEPSGFTPRHSHDWEHEVFFHQGNGQVFSNGDWLPVQAGSVVFIPGNEEHQFKNVGDSVLIFACVIPAGPPEL